MGKSLVFPTDTVYGLLANAQNDKAVRRIFRIKKRNIKNPIPIFVRDLEMAKDFAKIDENQEKILRKVWPGQVTVILKPKQKKLAKGIGKKGKEIGIRIPNYKLLNELLKRFKKPLAQTSANVSGKPTPTSIKGILTQLKSKRLKPDLAIDAGELGKKPSVILDLTEVPPKILRQ